MGTHTRPTGSPSILAAVLRPVARHVLIGSAVCSVVVVTLVLLDAASAVSGHGPAPHSVRSPTTTAHAPGDVYSPLPSWGGITTTVRSTRARDVSNRDGRDASPKSIIPSEKVQLCPPKSGRPSWQMTLYTPTFVSRINGTWFIVDCWHHRVLYAHGDAEGALGRPIEQWSAMDPVDEGRALPPCDAHMQPRQSKEHMRIPHSVAYDGTTRFVLESSQGGSDGDDHALLSYVRDGLRFRFDSSVVLCPPNRARRPHRVIYSARAKAFFVYLTKPPHLARISERTDSQGLKGLGVGLALDYCVPLPFMKGTYARSIFEHPDTGLLYITSGPKGIWSVNVSDPGGAVVPVKFYPLTRALGMKVMNDLLPVGAWWYATSTTPCAFRRFRSLDTMSDVEDLARVVGLCGTGRSQGTPYFLQYTEGRMYVPFIFGVSGVVSFALDPATGAITDVRRHWTHSWQETAADVAVRNLGW